MGNITQPPLRTMSRPLVGSIGGACGRVTGSVTVVRESWSARRRASSGMDDTGGGTRRGGRWPRLFEAEDPRPRRGAGWERGAVALGLFERGELAHDHAVDGVAAGRAGEDVGAVALLAVALGVARGAGAAAGAEHPRGAPAGGVHAAG